MRTGTGRSAALPYRPVAGKTGTSQGFRDAWFVGYSAQLIAGVWVGNDENRPMKRVTGGTIPAQIWKTFMQAATAGDPIEPLPGTDIVDVAPQVAAREDGMSAFDRLLWDLFEEKPPQPAPETTLSN
jgi:penicillin-binding protein 1A